MINVKSPDKYTIQQWAVSI
ncbi:Protein of unknown function [Leuconostoc citreum LBAE E16]|nr:Protein of unknown function [Leuconostoc citreum LBAE E16]